MEKKKTQSPLIKTMIRNKKATILIFKGNINRAEKKWIHQFSQPKILDYVDHKWEHNHLLYCKAA